MHIKYCLISFSHMNFCFCGLHSWIFQPSLFSAMHSGPTNSTPHNDMQITLTVCHYSCRSYTPSVDFHMNVHIVHRFFFFHGFILGWRLVVWVEDMWNVRCTSFAWKAKMKKINNRKRLVFQNDGLNLYVNGSSLPVTCWHFLRLWHRKVHMNVKACSKTL